MSDAVLYFWLLLPATMPLAVAVANSAVARSKHRLLWVGAVLLGAYAVALGMTSLAYHMRNAYLDLPALSVPLLIGIIWPCIATLPAFLVVRMPGENLRTSLVSGALLSLVALVVLTPANLALIVLFSLE